MSFQWIFDNASSISITTQPTVAQSITRNNIVKSVSRGGESYRITVQMPAGMPYTQARTYIQQYEEFDRITPSDITIPQSYILGYQGAGSISTGWQASVVTGTPSITITSTGSAVFPNNSLFKRGDIIQPINGKPYTVTDDINLPTAVVPVHRPVIEPTATYTINIGTAAVFRLMATKVPRWEIFDYDLVRWGGEFEFYEVL